MRTPVSFALAFGLITLAPASAQSLPAAQALFDQGKWQEAAAAAAALKTSQGYAFAAEATTAGARISSDSQKKALFEKAQGYAKQAIALDKNNATGYFELARSQGRLALFAGILQSLGLAKDMKKNLDTAIRLNPNYAAAYTGLGAWHAALDAKGLAARAATGANKAQVVPAFEKAIALEPNSPTHRLEYARALLLQGNKAGARAQLERAVAAQATTFWDKREVEEARVMLSGLK